ncbi:MAG: serine--tRNA ligase [Candidatus Pacebacteria bacterium]|jgi:seryl-tRNA synthetase|nr:serine--tRNA ligase [Candidatus Paceibacterota bacterium]|tara:strand:+ start:34337 stop:35593 length:1257 start_codon:yes stop_codon:yes gene_type:complete
MLDIKFIRENKDLVKAAAKKKHIEIDIDRLISVDDERKKKIASYEAKKAEHNTVSDQIANITDQSEKEHLISKMKMLKDVLSVEESELKEVVKEWQYIMVRVPNIPDMSVPEGESDADNKEIRKWGNQPEFSFEPKSHIELMENLDMVDFERGTKIAGFRGYVLKGDSVNLQFALFQFVQDNLKGFTKTVVPSLLNKESFLGTGFLPQSEEDLYKTQDESYLAGTSEVPMMGYYMDEVLDRKNLPIKFLAFSPCFRREAGSHGKDTKGLMRVHEFFKLEQVVLCEASHEESVRLHEEITKNSEKIMQALNIPYRIVINSGGDLGLGQVKKYDIESWIPSEKKYRETHSSSYFHDFQTRRLNIKYKDKEGKAKFAHSLNNTTIAAPRILIPLIENNQNEDGSINVPEVLREYIGKDIIK